MRFDQIDPKRVMNCALRHHHLRQRRKLAVAAEQNVHLSSFEPRLIGPTMTQPGRLARRIYYPTPTRNTNLPHTKAAVLDSVVAF